MGRSQLCLIAGIWRAERELIQTWISDGETMTALPAPGLAFTAHGMAAPTAPQVWPLLERQNSQ